MGEADVRAVAGGVVAALREAGRSEGTIRRYQAVLDRFAAFLAGRGLSTASDQACVDFIAGQTGIRLGALREPVADRNVKAVRRPVVLMADALAGRAVVIGRPVIPAKDGCPARLRLLRDDYVASCRARQRRGDPDRQGQGGQPVPGLPGRGRRRSGNPGRAGRVGFPAAATRAAAQDHRGPEIGPGRLPGLPSRCGPGTAGPGRPAAAAPASPSRVRAAPVDR